MYTLGYAFRPWTRAKAIADGPSILEYLKDTAKAYGIDKHIRFGHRVKSAAWSSQDARWTVEAERGPQGEPVRFTCNFLFMCSGYYNYAEGYTPQFPGAERFAGRIVHPQKWTEDIDYANKRVVVIGSGATAVTIVPEMAKTAARVTMLQRSPTYVISLPAEDFIANGLRRVLPLKLAYLLTRWKNVLFGMLFFQLSRRRPAIIKKLIRNGVRKHLGPDYDIDTHFTPRYNPWDQRLCLVPNGDLFEAIKAGSVDVVTDQIDTFTPQGIALRSGRQLEADLIVTATGLNLQLLGGVQVSVDGRDVDLSKTLNYKGMMFSDVPNMASSFGYTNASWTLKCDLTCEYVCRLLNHMQKLGLRQCMPRNVDPSLAEEPWIDFSSGYVQRSLHQLPKQGSKLPWKLHQNYAFDIMMLRWGSVDDGVMEFKGADATATPLPAAS
jgi:cation diffusion facilitator CzcD-associated flavoprotein CzcO